MESQILKNPHLQHCPEKETFSNILLLAMTIKSVSFYSCVDRVLRSNEKKKKGAIVLYD